MEEISTQKVAKLLSNPAELRPQSVEMMETLRWKPSVSEQRTVKSELSSIEGAAIEKLILSKRKSNFIRVREQLKPYLMAKYGMIGTFIERDEYPPYPAIPGDDDPVFRGLSAADRNKLKEKMLSSRAKYHDKFEEDKVKIFGDLLKVTPQDGIETMAQRPEWAEIYEAKDPRRLWNVIKSVFGRPGIAENIHRQKTMMEDEYYGCKQFPNESDKDYLDRFVLASQNLEQLGEEYRVREADQSRRFVMNLDVRHKDMIAGILNGVGGGMPTTVAAAYNLISKWVSRDTAAVSSEEMMRVPIAFYSDEREYGLCEESEIEERASEKPRFRGECYVCGKAGHKAYQCKQKKSSRQSSRDEREYGLCEESKTDERASEKPRFIGECYVCGKAGHKAYQCKQKKI